MRVQEREWKNSNNLHALALQIRVMEIDLRKSARDAVGTVCIQPGWVTDRGFVGACDKGC